MRNHITAHTSATRELKSRFKPAALNKYI
jgi:hypothetical protein